MDWISELVLKRNSQRSNCYIVETIDPKRVSQLKEILASSRFDELVRVKYVRVLLYDVQTNELINIRDRAPVNLDPMASLVSQFGSMLRDAPSVLVVKYVYSESHANMLSEMIVAFSHDDDMYRHKSTVIVFTTNAMLFSESVRRFAHVIRVVPSTQEERRAILSKIAGDLALAFKEKYGKEIKLRIDEDLVQATGGLTLHDIETAALESFYTVRKFDVSVFTKYKIDILSQFEISYVLPTRGFETVGGYDLLKQYIRNNIIRVLRNPDVAKRYGLSIPKGIILAGFHGCGKTFIARAMAKEIGLPMIEISSATFLRGIVGATEQRVTQITALIESLSPAIVFIDEIDELALAREKTMITDSGVRRSMQNLLMRWLGDEDRKSFIVGATNLIEDIDPAFIRAGRIDDVILVLPPDRRAREEILKVHTSVVRVVPLANDVDLSYIAERTAWWTGAELEKLVLDAARLAMNDDSPYVRLDHFERAMRTFCINVNERVQRVQRMVQVMQKLENVNQAFLREALKIFAKEEKDTRIQSLVESL